MNEPSGVLSPHYTGSGIQRRKAPLALKSVLMLFFISGILGVLIRFSGEMAGIGFLRDTLPIKLANIGIGFLVFSVTVLVGIRRNIYALVYVFSFIALLSITFAHLVFGTPAKDAAWNTIPFELFRSFSLGWYLFAIFLVSQTTRLPHNRILKLALYSSSLMVLFAILQSINILPNFYFQWYLGLHLPRPTGGLEHPHFFSLLLVLSTCLAVVGLEKELISKRATLAFGAVFLIGILVSTSRVGFISELVFLTTYAFLRLDFSRLTIFLVLLILATILTTLWILINWEMVSTWPIINSVSVFLSAFQEIFDSDTAEGRFLRGRGERWAHELELIEATPMTLLFGYGHQPFVSHNLILRQLQVSGVIGTLCYISMLCSCILYWFSQVSKEYRAPITAILTSFAVSSITFPVLVSVTITCGLVLLAACVITIPKPPEYRPS